MFFQEATPDTSGYMIAGYVITFVVMALYVASIYLRNRNLNQDLDTLDELENPASRVQTKAASPLRKNSSRPESDKSVRPVTKQARRK
jgi:hypothetical protein